MRFLKSAGLVIMALMGPKLYGIEFGELNQWERQIEGETELALGMAEELKHQLKIQYGDKKQRVFRDAHPRGIACVEGRFEVEANIPVAYQTGVYAVPGRSYEAILRFSSSLGPTGDNAKDARGLAIKLFGVSGEKLSPGQPTAQTQDFLHINVPSFLTEDSRDFAGLVKFKSNPLSIASYLAAAPIRRAKVLSALFKATQHNPYLQKSLLEMTFFSQTPYLLKGPFVDKPLKFLTRPCGPIEERELDGTANELRNDLQERLYNGTGCFEFLVQFFEPGRGLEVENGTNEWTEAKAPYVKLATVHIPEQHFLTDKKLAYCDSLSFHPWHTLPEHRPLGNINRTRLIVYEAISQYRHEMNQEEHLLQEPENLDYWHSLDWPRYKVWRGITIPLNSD